MLLKSTSLRKNLDLIGFSASFLCAIHCALVPFIVSFGALSILSFMTHPLIEPVVLTLSFIIAISSLIPSYLRHHRSFLPVLLLAVGFVGIITGRLVEEEWMEVAATATGAFIIAFAHLKNWKMMKNFRSCEVTTKNE